MQVRNENRLTTDQKSALNIWRDRLKDHTLSKEQHDEAHRMIAQILFDDALGELQDRVAVLEAKLGIVPKVDGDEVELTASPDKGLEPAPQPPKRKRRTKAEIEADKAKAEPAAETEKPDSGLVF